MIDKVIYLAGPYRAPTPYGIRENIRVAEHYAIEFWNRDVPVLSPHKNTSLLDGAAPDEVWLEGDLILLSRCDVLVLLPGWTESRGTRLEKLKAEQEFKIPVFEIVEGVRMQIDRQLDRIVEEIEAMP